jgi:hypothetical protein
MILVHTIPTQTLIPMKIKLNLSLLRSTLICKRIGAWDKQYISIRFVTFFFQIDEYSNSPLSSRDVEWEVLVKTDLLVA